MLLGSLTLVLLGHWMVKVSLIKMASLSPGWYWSRSWRWAQSVSIGVPLRGAGASVSRPSLHVHTCEAKQRKEIERL